MRRQRRLFAEEVGDGELLSFHLNLQNDFIVYVCVYAEAKDRRAGNIFTTIASINSLCVYTEAVQHQFRSLSCTETLAHRYTQFFRFVRSKHGNKLVVKIFS